MKELTRTKRLRIATIIFILIIGTGFLTLRKPKYEFRLSPDQMIGELSDIYNEVLPDPEMKTWKFGDAGMVMVDVRYPDQFAKGHLGEAVNIPVSDILLEENMNLMKQWQKDSLMVVLYGQNQRHANGPWMILKQLGFSNVQVFLGGMDYMENHFDDLYNQPEVPEYLVEEPQMDFGEFMAKMEGNSGNRIQITRKTKKIVPVKRKKKTVTEGGC